MNENESYIYGLLIADGSLSLAERNRGKVTLEISTKDRDIVEKLYQEIPNSSISNRTRTTNFAENAKFVRFNNSRKEFRDRLIECGFPTKDKTNNANTPTENYEKFHYWRGVIDGDGSLGFTADGIPFVSLVTKSETLKQKYCSFLKEEYGIEKRLNRNKRDNVYNIVIKNEDAVQLAKDLYLENQGVYINRKYKKAQDIQKWVRTKKKASRRRMWNEEQDKYILSHTLTEPMKHLDRTASSIKNRLFRLKKQHK